MVYYTTGVLICLPLYFICCALVTGSNAGSGYKEVFDGSENYEVVIPRKVTSTGKFISNFIPHHYKRSSYGNRTKRDANLENSVHYIIPLSGIDHHVELAPNYNFIGPGMVIEKHDKRRLSGRNIRQIGDDLCHFTGFIKGDKNSKVSLSTCNGLSGYIRTKRNYFLIQPARTTDPFIQAEQPHIISATNNIDGIFPSCETSGDLVKIMAKRALKQERQAGTGADKCAAELYIETLIVLDHSMLTYHKDIDLENYVLTVFNMAHDLYHDASLGTNINLAIVRLIRLEDEDHEMNLAINKDVTKSLNSFCEWQHNINPTEDSHPNHHDVAILLTRIDICGNDNTCGLLGASKLGAMCDPHNQAAICEDNGLRLGFIIAHEIAHTLAIMHDTPKESGCNSTLPRNLTTVMSPTVSIRTSEWSPCSSKFLQLFIDSGFGKCLYDQPTEHSFTPEDVLPGVMYDADYQCREIFGPNAALCMTGIDCGNLICYIEDKGCVETHTGVAPGTSCGEKKWCYHGECIEIGERLNSCDGGWGAWSEWSTCSRTCGSGVATQERHCDSPPPSHGGKYCAGEHKQYKICSTEPCDINQPNFRDVQCAEFDSWVYPEDGKVHQWKSYSMPEENPCVLFCVNDWGDVASLRPRVIDGTTCQHHVRDICINGLCKEIPCDLDLESEAVEDVCGVCKGDGTSCTLVDGEVSVPCCGHISEEQVLIIPEKSVNIKIEEMVPTESRIQIRNKDGETVFIIGNALGTFNVPGSSAWVGNIRIKQEAISIPGPISDPISVWLVVVENVTIRYTYGSPAKSKRQPTFSWDYLSWSRCSSECGPGIEESVPSCVEVAAGLVDNCFCAQITKPKVQIRTCEIAPCITRWFIADWQPCNKCPSGKRNRIVKCVRPTGQGEGEVIFVSDSQCIGPKPKSSESCTCIESKSSNSTNRLANRIVKRTSGHSPHTSHNRTQPNLALNTTTPNVLHNATQKNITSNITEIDEDTPREKNVSEICDLLSSQMGNIIIDKDDMDKMVLTIHTELENGHRPQGIPNPECDEDQGRDTVTLHGKAAIKFLNEMQKNFENNKTKI